MKVRFQFVMSCVALAYAALLTGCHSMPTHHDSRESLETFYFEDLPPVEGTDLKLGGFSGLVFEGYSKLHGEYDFTTLTDRGPNEDARKEGTRKEAGNSNLRPFVAPNFSPRFVQFSFDPIKKKVGAVDEIPMKRFDGSPMTGLPNIFGLDETPIDKIGHRLALDKLGVDTEGLAKDPADGSYWACEEYRPSILHFDKNAKLLQRWIPKDTATGTGVPQLPKWYVKRVPNRGFEGIAVDGERVVAFLQSPLEGDYDVTRVLAVEKSTGRPAAEYVYAFETKEEGRSPADKIGDAVTIGNGRYLVVEQNGFSDERGVHRIYEIDVNDATDLLSRKGAPLSAHSLCLEGVATKSCVKPVKKKLVADLVALGLHGFDKIEGLAVIDSQTLALVNDNDFDVSKSGSPSAFFIVHLAEPLKLSY